jgi:hypothetical protein
MTSISLAAPRLFQPRSMALGVTGSLFGLVSLLYLSNVPIELFTRSAHLPAIQFHTPHPALHKHPATAVHPAATQTASDDSIAFSGVALHANRRTYTYIFGGQILCGNAPCRSVNVLVTVDTPHNHGIQKYVKVNPDGNFSLPVTLIETPHEAIDWHVSVQTSDDQISDLRGRQILMDDATVTIDTPFQL